METHQELHNVMNSALDVKDGWDWWSNMRDCEVNFAEFSVVQQKKRTVKWQSYWREFAAELFFTHSLTVDQINQPYTIH